MWACLVVLLAAYLSRTFLRNRDWATEETLFTSAAKVPFLSTVYMPHYLHASIDEWCHCLEDLHYEAIHSTSRSPEARRPLQVPDET